jgi:hypothetical protein
VRFSKISIWVLKVMKVAVNKERPQLPANCHPAVAKLITDGWNDNPNRRPNAHSILDTLTHNFPSPFLNIKSNNNNSEGVGVSVRCLRSHRAK